MRLWPLALGAVAALGGCEEKPRPWSRGEGPPAVLAPVPGGGAATPGSGGADPAEPSGEAQGGHTPDSSSSSSAVPGDASGAPSATDAGTTTDTAGADADERSRVTPGGGWVKCHEGLSLSGDPLKDVTRLGLLCGPSNGMRRKSKQAIVGLVGEHEPPVTVTFEATRGACYRIFAAADAPVHELDVNVRSSHDVGVAADHSSGRLAIVQPDRPFCTFSDEKFTVEISARRGNGRFAAEVWGLGEPVKRRDLMESPPDETPIDKP